MGVGGSALVERLRTPIGFGQVPSEKSRAGIAARVVEQVEVVRRVTAIFGESRPEIEPGVLIEAIAGCRVRAGCDHRLDGRAVPLASRRFDQAPGAAGIGWTAITA